MEDGTFLKTHWIIPGEQSLVLENMMYGGWMLAVGYERMLCCLIFLSFSADLASSGSSFPNPLYPDIVVIPFMKLPKTDWALPSEAESLGRTLWPILTIAVGSKGKTIFPEMEVGTKGDERNTRGDIRSGLSTLHAARRFVSTGIRNLCVC